jgi:DNA-binding MarR family transcriptional regulator
MCILTYVNAQSHVQANYDHIAATCAMFATRRLSRSITRIYDAALAPSGLRATQYNVLVAIARSAGETMTELGARLGMDRTTLTHALRSLTERGLVADVATEDRRVRTLALTPLGQECAATAIPLWEQAQVEVECALGGAAQWERLNGELRGLSRALRKRAPAEFSKPGPS